MEPDHQPHGLGRCPHVGRIVLSERFVEAGPIDRGRKAEQRMRRIEKLPQASPKQIEQPRVRGTCGLQVCLKLQEKETIRPSSLLF